MSNHQNDNFEEHQEEIRQEKIRSDAQNRALHKYCEEVALELNERGITQRAVINTLETMGIDNTMFSVKRLFQIIGEAKFGKSETHRFTTKEMGEVEKEVNNIIVRVSKGEINMPFPSSEFLGWQNIINEE